MLPLHDNTPNVHRPHMVRAVIIVNTLVFLIELGLSEQALFYVFHLLGFVPVRLMHPEWAMTHGYPGLGPLPFVSHMFLHSGWLHLIGNMWTLWIFGDNIEDVMGPFRFLAFYLCCGIAALMAHALFNADSAVPVVGASGAIAGVMGAYLVLYPHAKVVTFFFFFPIFVEIPAALFLGVWFLTQIFSGFSMAQSSNVAWWAHAGGFVAGILLLRIFENPRRCLACRSAGKRTQPFWAGPNGS